VTEASSTAHLWGIQVRAALMQAQRLLRTLHQVLKVLSASTFRKRMLISVAAALTSLALLVLLLEISLRNELARESSYELATALPTSAGSAEVQPLDPLAALMGAPAADDLDTFAQSSVTFRKPVPLPRPRLRSP
jgi:hypothetical protein